MTGGQLILAFLVTFALTGLLALATRKRPPVIGSRVPAPMWGARTYRNWMRDHK
jgi:hypothetical protein